MNTFSTAASLPLPRWAYVPGESADAEADHDTLWHAKALVPSRFRDFVPARHPALRYGIALNDAGYFWESHEVLEAVWAAARADVNASCCGPAFRSPAPTSGCGCRSPMRPRDCWARRWRSSVYSARARPPPAADLPMASRPS